QAGRRRISEAAWEFSREERKLLCDPDHSLSPPFVLAQAGTQSFRRHLTPGPPLPRGRTEKNGFNCETAKLKRPQVWSGLGFARLFFPSPKVRGRGAPEQAQEEGTRLSSAPPLFPLSRSTVPGPTAAR